MVQFEFFGRAALRRGLDDQQVVPTDQTEPLHPLTFPIENRYGLRQFDGVKLATFLAMFLALSLAAGCKKKAEATLATSEKPWEPTQAQPTLPKMKIYLGAETLDTEVATSQREEQTGMMFRTNVTDESAMLFVFPYPQPANFWMKNCPHSLSAAYISPDGVIQEIHHLEKNDTNTVSSATADIGYVLEVNDGWFQRHGISTGALVRTEAGSLQQTFFRNRQ